MNKPSAAQIRLTIFDKPPLQTPPPNTRNAARNLKNRPWTFVWEPFVFKILAMDYRGEGQTAKSTGNPQNSAPVAKSGPALPKYFFLRFQIPAVKV